MKIIRFSISMKGSHRINDSYCANGQKFRIRKFQIIIGTFPEKSIIRMILFNKNKTNVRSKRSTEYSAKKRNQSGKRQLYGAGFTFRTSYIATVYLLARYGSKVKFNLKHSIHTRLYLLVFFLSFFVLLLLHLTHECTNTFKC